MISDFPMGSGFQAAFDSPRGQPYMWEIGVERHRSVHNGFLDVMASWGIQGFLLLAPAYLIAFGYLHNAIGMARSNGQFKSVFFASAGWRIYGHAGYRLFQQFAGQRMVHLVDGNGIRFWQCGLHREYGRGRGRGRGA